MASVVQLLDKIDVKLATVQVCADAVIGEKDLDLSSVALVLTETHTNLKELVEELGEIAKKAE